MEKDFEVLRACPLFSGIPAADLPGLLDCLSATGRRYARQQFVLHAGDTLRVVGIVLSGAVHIVQEDFWGNRTILASVEPGGLFGEAFACAEVDSLPVSALAVQPTHVLWVDTRKIITLCPSGCAFHTRLQKNMIRVLAEKNVMLTQKIEAISRRTTRGKLLAFLSFQAQQAQSSRFTIPYNRQELAEYLAVDRSAMSHELSKMQADGILAYRRNQFELRKPGG